MEQFKGIAFLNYERKKKMYMRIRWICALILIVFFFSGQGYASSVSLVKLESRPGIEQKFILIKPDSPIAGVVLFEGGHGGLNLYSTFTEPGLKWNENGFLARTRKKFADQGFMVALVDSPEDKKKMDAIWRMSSEHAEDMKAVVKALKKEANVPIWVIGMSMGTFSAANTAIMLSPEVNGLVLVSSITRSKKDWRIYPSHPRGIINMNFNEVLMPTLIVSHKEDECELSPAKDAPDLEAELKNSKKLEVLYFTGGKKAVSKPCLPLSPHGYYGIEEDVVSAISNFIKSNSN